MQKSHRDLKRPAPAVLSAPLEGALLEVYDYEPGPPADIGRHVHEAYQIGLALDLAGEYRYRGSTEPVPTGRLVIIHPGEPHAVRDTSPRPSRARYLMMYIDPALFVGEGRVPLPFFDEPLSQPALLAGFIDVFRSADSSADAASALTSLVTRLSDHASGARCDEPAPARLNRVRERLHDDPVEDESLARLAARAGLHPHHLVRAFTAHFGLPPHAYRRALRIERARRLLSLGEPPSRVALDCGFYDQSHFGRHFRRTVGTTPGRYRGTG